MRLFAKTVDPTTGEEGSVLFDDVCPVCGGSALSVSRLEDGTDRVSCPRGCRFGPDDLVGAERFGFLEDGDFTGAFHEIYVPPAKKQ